MAPRAAIRTDLHQAGDLRRLARGEAVPRAARRMLAIANAMEGMSHSEAARVVGIERQSLGDAIRRYNAEGLAGLYDRPKPGRPRKLTPVQEDALGAAIAIGPDPDVDGISAYTLEDLADLAASRFGVGYHPASMSRVVRRLGFSKQKARPHHPDKDEAAQAALGGLGERLRAVAAAHPGKRLRLMFEDEARIGQKGRVCHRWFRRGRRPPGPADQRTTFAYIYAAVEPGTDTAFALVLPEVSTRAMQAFLDGLTATLAEDEHVLLVLDRAGWHGANALVVPANITLAALPPRSPELNPVERLWLYLKERFLSHRLLEDYTAIVDAACAAWRRVTSEPGRIASLCSYPWIIERVSS